MNTKRDILWRLYSAFFVFILLGVLVLFQIANIQVLERHSNGKLWSETAHDFTYQLRPISSERGNIFDQSGNLLATSVPTYNISFDAVAQGLSDSTFMNHVHELALKIAGFTKTHDKNYYYNLLVSARKNKKQYLPLIVNANYNDLEKIKTWPIFKEGKNKGGLIVEPINKRKCPYGMLAYRTLGYLRDTVGHVGLEKKFNSSLSGERGLQLMEKTSIGLWRAVNEDDEVIMPHGNDIVTTIDIELQDVLEHALLKALQSTKADHGCAVLMEVSTGKIKAIANLGKRSNHKYDEIFNYAVGETTEPGSTFKLMSALALIDDGYVTPETKVDIENGKKKFNDLWMKDAKEHDYREVSFQFCFENSSNVGFSKLITKHYQHQPQKFIEKIKQTGLDQALNFEIQGEPNPYIKNIADKSWSGTTLPWMAIGYEVSLTPLQILAFYNAIANNGKLVKPFLVEKILNDGKVITQFETIVLNEKICKESTVKKLRALLEAVVENGTSTNVKNDYYRLAGKTGTAKISNKKSGYKNSLYQASFCGYFPAENPKYSCIVVINSPSSGLYYGSKVAAPVFKEVADKIYATSFDIHQNINKKKSLIAENFPITCKGYLPDIITISKLFKAKNKDFTSKNETWAEVKILASNLQIHDFDNSDHTVPNLTGMGLRDALYLLESKGLVVEVQGKGSVKHQSLNAGAPIKKGQLITLLLSS